MLSSRGSWRNSSQIWRSIVYFIFECATDDFPFKPARKAHPTPTHQTPTLLHLIALRPSHSPQTKKEPLIGVSTVFDTVGRMLSWFKIPPDFLCHERDVHAANTLPSRNRKLLSRQIHSARLLFGHSRGAVKSMEGDHSGAEGRKGRRWGEKGRRSGG